MFRIVFFFAQGMGEKGKRPLLVASFFSGFSCSFWCISKLPQLELQGMDPSTTQDAFLFLRSKMFSAPDISYLQHPTAINSRILAQSRTQTLIPCYMALRRILSGSSYPNNPLPRQPLRIPCCYPSPHPFSTPIHEIPKPASGWWRWIEKAKATLFLFLFSSLVLFSQKLVVLPFVQSKFFLERPQEGLQGQEACCHRPKCPQDLFE